MRSSTEQAIDGPVASRRHLTRGVTAAKTDEVLAGEWAARDEITLLDLLTSVPYSRSMRATLTSKGQITIPTAIRQRLGLKPGQVLEFDESTPYLMAVPVFDEPAMRALLGCTRGRLGKTTAEWLDETRGPATDEEQ
jgi:antitoxin PrlF